MYFTLTMKCTQKTEYPEFVGVRMEDDDDDSSGFFSFRVDQKEIAKEFVPGQSYVIKIFDWQPDPQPTGPMESLAGQSI